jgi:hypothetical protein
MIKIKSIVSSVLLTSVVSTSVFAGNYCAGIRGNGEMAPAHWSSLSRIVENKGLPSTIAGGSSAAITLFLLDSLSRNDKLSQTDNKKHQEQALLLKSLVPHLMYLYEVDAKSPIIMRAIGLVTGMGDGGFFHKVKSALKIAKDLPTFMEILGDYGPLLNPEMVKGLKRNFGFYKGQIMEAVKVFGSFDAKNDMNLFYREGLVDFKFLGILFGRIGDFYAGYGNVKANKKLDTFLTNCSDVAVGKEWIEMAQAKASCHKEFYAALDAYYEKPLVTKYRNGRKVRVKVRGDRKFPNKMIFSKVGSGLKAFPTTSIIVGNAVQKFQDRMKEYEEKNAIGVLDFSLDFDTELKYGYWGKTQDLEMVGANLRTDFPNDTKSGKFHAIEGGTWFEVLATSPAEPGLSNIQRIPDSGNMSAKKIIDKKYFKKKWYIFPTLNAIGWFNEKDNKGVIPFREDMYSSGGWSDLHPTIVLKASGCDDIMYITRQGGESVFGQQIFIRLTGYTDKISFWKDIKEGNRRGWTDLSEDEENSPWNKLYNLANPDSSFNTSLRTMDSVYCTNWDGFNAFKPGELQLAQTDAFNAPLFLKDESRRSVYQFGLDFEGKSPDKFPGCIIKNFN